MKEQIKASVEDVIKASQLLLQEASIKFIEEASSKIAHCYLEGGKLLIAGNGGSLCDAMHFAEELTGFYREKRKAYPAIALSDPGHLTCVGNDVGFNYVFSRGIEALGQSQDIFISLSTSGNSLNLVEGVKKAKELGLYTIAFLGKEGGALKNQCDLEWIVSGFKYSDRIQEVHMSAIHIIIEMVEKKLADHKQGLSKPSLSLRSFS